MPVTIKRGGLKFRDASSGEYIDVDVVGERKTSEQIADIEAAGAAERSAIQTKGEQTRASIPADYTDLSDSVGDLKSAFDSVSEQIESVEVTQSLNTSYVGVTVERVNENTIKIYGTSTAARRILCLNGQNNVATSSTSFSKTLDANTYAVSVSATGYTSEQNIFSWQYTYTTFANAVTVVTLASPNDIINLSQDAMFGLTFSTGADFGTSENATYITINVKRYIAKDEVARSELAETIRYTVQTLTEEQEAQARDNIDCVGNDTLYKYNFYDALAFGNGESGLYKGITYTRNDDNSWTISGTATALSFRNIINSTTEIPRFIIPGRKYKFLFNGGTIPVRLFVYKNGSSIFAETYTQDFEYTFPTDMDGVIVRYQIENGTAISPEVTVKYTFVPETVTSIDNQYTYNTTVEQTVQQISNTYDLNVSPSITTDDHGWLMAVDTNTSSETGKTDMTAAIMAMLTETGYCHLSEGIFYVSGNIDMPSRSTLCGCGKTTIIRLLQSVSSGYAIKMTSLNTLKDLCVSGAYSAPSAWTQTRTGILFAANQDGQEGTTQYETDRCLMNNVWVENFTDSGIKCHNTSQSVRKGLYANNVMTAACWCGLNIDYNSEFNKFTNVLTSQCVIGCTNNGGNNVFTACTFHGASIGFKVDGTQPNSAHGTINGCTFCHAGSNSGSAITMTGIDNGFVISDSQIWHNSIDLTNCSGIVFSGCEFGRTTNSGVPINISGGNTIMFNGCVFMLDSTYTPNINITNNTKVKFDGCYGSESGNIIYG